MAACYVVPVVRFDLKEWTVYTIIKPNEVLWREDI
jgi:hypothetical protein